MEEWDAQKMLDLYIYDYLLRKNMHTTADILAKEADIQPKSVVINPPDGFLSEWWSIFWDVYSSRVPKNSQGEGSSSQPPMAMSDGLMEQNAQPASALPPVPDHINTYMLQSMNPSSPPPGLPNLFATDNPAPMKGPDMRGFQQNAFPPMMPNMDQNQNRFGQIPVSITDNNAMRKEQLMAELAAQRAREQEHRRLPPTSFEANLNASMSPLASGSSRRQKKVNSKRQFPVSNEINYGTGHTGLRRSATSELTPHAPKLIQDDIGQADAGHMMTDSIPSHGCSSMGLGYGGNAPLSDQHIMYSSSEGCPADSSFDLAAQASKKLIISGSENSTMMVGPNLSNDGSRGKGVQFERNAEIERPTDEEIAAFFSNDESSENMSASFTQTAAQKQNDEQDFPFGLVRSLHPSNNKLSCLDFSSQGKYLAAAGHEKKVFLWNLRQSTRSSFQAHTQLITDIRFKPNSNIFATSSFDRAVKIWDAANSKTILFNLVGHGDQVMSVDFHPRKPNLVCSCDCSDEIRLWNAKESSCSRYFKGANRQVRFQPRQGNLLAAAMGNVINLLDVETSMIQYRFEGHEEDVRALCWDIRGEYLVSVSNDSARIWSIVSGGKCIYMLPSSGRDFASCTFHPAYSQVVTVGSYESIYIWNPTMGNQTWKFHGHQGIISAMANAPDTNMLASASHDQWVKMWK